MAKKSKQNGRQRSTTKKKPIEQYEHRDKKRLNNPPVGLVSPETDPIEPPAARHNYQYDLTLIRS